MFAWRAVVRTNPAWQGSSGTPMQGRSSPAWGESLADYGGFRRIEADCSTAESRQETAEQETAEIRRCTLIEPEGGNQHSRLELVSSRAGYAALGHHSMYCRSKLFITKTPVSCKPRLIERTSLNHKSTMTTRRAQKELEFRSLPATLADHNSAALKTLFSQFSLQEHALSGTGMTRADGRMSVG